MLPAAGLIGQNILSEQGIHLLQSKGTLSLDGVEIPLVNWAGKVDRTKNPGDWLTTKRTTIRLAEEGILPPLSECVLAGEVVCEPSNRRFGIAETDLLDVSGLAGAYSLVGCSEDGRQPVRIVNTTLKEVKLPRNKAVGVLVPAVVTEQPVEEAVGRLISTADLCNKFDLSHVSEPEKSRIQDLISEFSSAFSSGDTDIGHGEVIKHRIPTNDAAPVYRRAYRIPYANRDDMDKRVKDLVDQGIIEHSTYTWGAPALLIEKPDGSYRFIVDYRDLNSVTRVDPYPLPNISETLSELGSAKFFTVVDMASGYWKIEMHENDREKTAFNTPSYGDVCLWG